MIQNYIEKLFGINATTSATILISLFVFIMGYLLSALVREANRFIGRKANRKALIVVLDEFIISLKNQIDAIEDQLQSFDLQNSGHWGMWGQKYYQIDVVKQIGYKTCFES